MNNDKYKHHVFLDDQNFTRVAVNHLEEFKGFLDKTIGKEYLGYRFGKDLHFKCDSDKDKVLGVLYNRKQEPESVVCFITEEAGEKVTLIENNILIKFIKYRSMKTETPSKNDCKS
jgi:hypothetical protein